MSTVIDVYDIYHLGDQLINFIFFYQIKEYIEANNIIIHYRCEEKYHKNINDFNCSKNIILFPLELIGYNLWQGTVDWNDPYTNKHFQHIEDILINMFNLFLKEYNIPIVVNVFEFIDTDLLVRYNNLEEKYKNIDMLIINSHPLSNQFSYNKELFDEFIIKLSKKYSIATTEKVNDDILSLNEMSVKNIGAISTQVKTIIAVNTGPSLSLYNTYTLDYANKIYILDNSYDSEFTFKTRKFEKTNDINKLQFLLDTNNVKEQFNAIYNEKMSWVYYILLFLIFIIVVLITHFLLCKFFKIKNIKFFKYK